MVIDFDNKVLIWLIHYTPDCVFVVVREVDCDGSTWQGSVVEERACVSTCFDLVLHITFTRLTRLFPNLRYDDENWQTVQAWLSQQSSSNE